MKLKTAVQAILFAVAVGIPPQARSGEFTAEVTAVSKYVFRGLELGDLTLHPSAEFSQGDFYAGIWSALPLENKGAPDFFGDEHDFYAGYGFALADKVALDLGGTYYHYPNVEDTFEGYLGLLGELGTFSPALYIYNDFDLDVFTVEASTGVAIPLQGFPVEATARLGRVTGDGDYTYYGLDLIYPIQLADFSRLSFGLHYSDNDFGSGAPDNHLYGSAALRLSF